MNFTRPTVLSLLSFEGADLYGEKSDESLVHTSALQALEAMLDDSELRYSGDVDLYLETTELFLSVAAYYRMVVSSGYRDRWAESLVELLREAFGEEHGNEEGDDRLSDDAALELRARAADLVSWYVAAATVWHCEKLRTWTFDRDDLRELVAELRPAWLNKPAAPSSDGAP